MEPNNNNNIDNVRKPDKVICERLIDDYSDDKNYTPLLTRSMTSTYDLIDIENDSDSFSREKKQMLLPRLCPSPTTHSIWNIENEEDELQRAIQESLLIFQTENNIISESEISENKKVINENVNKNNNVNETKDISNDNREEQSIKPDILPIFKYKMKRLISFDKQLKEFYEKISPIIELYENGEILYHITSTAMYNNIFKILHSVRIPKEEWSILETIFVKQV
jgi:hypothetical protein